MSNFDTYIRRICMKRFISIQEFLDSFKFNEPLYPNTLRYLYNADYQNGLYIDKSPANSGSNKLVNLLLLYRIAKWATCGSDVKTVIEFYDPNPDLAYSSLLKDLKSSSLFVESKKGSSINEMALLDRFHVYYLIEDSILASSKRLIFKSTSETSVNSEISVNFNDLSQFGYAVPGQKIGISKGLFLGIVARDVDNEKLYTDILNKKLYESMDYRLYPEKIHEKPFAIVRCPFLENFKPLTFDDKNIIEINCPPYVKEYLGKSTVMDSYGQWDEEKKAEDFDVFLHEYKIKFIKPYHCPVEPSSISIEDCDVISGPEADKIYEESQTKNSRREALKRFYGLVEHWDYEFID